MNKKLNREIWSLTWPNALSNITIPLLGMADTLIAGLAGGDIMIGGVMVGTTIFNFIYMNCSFLRMGTTGLTAQSYGASDYTRSRQILIQALSIGLVIATIMLLFQSPIIRLSILAMGGSDNIMACVYEYVKIRIWALPAAIPLFAFNGWFVGMQDAKSPLYISVIANIINISLSAVFALHMNMGIAGIALGTVIAQYISLFIFIYLTYIKGIFNLHFTRQELALTLGRKSIGSFFRINSDVFLRNLCITTAYTIFTRVSANLSDSILASNALLMQLFTLYSYIFDGCAYAGETLTGRFIGSKDIKNYQSVCRSLFVWGFAISVFYVMTYAVAWRDILSLFKSSTEVINNAGDNILYIVAIPLLGCTPYMIDGIMFGSTNVRPLLYSSAISLAVFIICLYCFVPYYGNDGLWISFIIFTTMRGVLLIKPLIKLYKAPFK